MVRPRGRPRAAVPVAAAAVAILLAPLMACAPTGATTGRIVAVDDTGLPDRPVDGGWVLAVDSLEVLPELLGADLPPEHDLPHWSVPVDLDRVAGLGAEVAPVDGRGRFALDRSPPMALCRVADQPGGVPVVRGCTRVDDPERDQLELITGEGGLALRAGR